MVYGLNAPNLTNLDFRSKQLSKGVIHFLELGIKSLRIPIIWSRFYEVDPKTNRLVPIDNEFSRYKKLIELLPPEFSLFGYLCCPPSLVCKEYFFDQSSLETRIAQFFEQLNKYQISFSEWELGNEPNASDFYLSVQHPKWGHKPWTPKQYMYDFVIPAIRCIKKNNPNAKICIGALAENGIVGHNEKKIPISNLVANHDSFFSQFKSKDPHGQFYFAPNFAQELIRVYSNLKKEVKNDIDAFSIHPYPYFNIEGKMEYAKHSLELINDFIQASEHLDSFPEIWLTEIGCRTLDVRNNYRRSMQDQAEFLANIADSDMVNSKISRIYWYKYMDGGYDLVNEKTFGLVDRFQNPKPSFHRLKFEHLRYNKSISHYIDSFVDSETRIEGVVNEHFWRIEPLGEKNNYYFLDAGYHEDGRCEIAVFPGRNAYDSIRFQLKPLIQVTKNKFQIGFYYNVSDYNTCNSIVWSITNNISKLTFEVSNKKDFSWQIILKLNEELLTTWTVEKDYVAEKILPFLRYIEFGVENEVFYARINFTAFVEYFNFKLPNQFENGNYSNDVTFTKNDNKASFIKFSDYYIRTQLDTQIPFLNTGQIDNRYRFYHHDVSRNLFYSWVSYVHANPEMLYFLEITESITDSNVADLRLSKFWEGFQFRLNKKKDVLDQGIFISDFSESHISLIKSSLSDYIHCCHISQLHLEIIKNMIEDLNVFSFCLTGEVVNEKEICRLFELAGYKKLSFPKETWYYKFSLEKRRKEEEYAELIEWPGFQKANKLLLSKVEIVDSEEYLQDLDEFKKDFYNCRDLLSIKKIELFLNENKLESVDPTFNEFVLASPIPDRIITLLEVFLMHKKLGYAIRLLNLLKGSDLNSFVDFMEHDLKVKEQYNSLLLEFLKIELNKKNNPTLYRYIFKNKLAGESKKLKLHIGTYKTGTTAIQNCFFSERQTLKDHDFEYPKVGKFVRSAHFDLYDYLKGDYDPEITKDLNSISKENRIILSCEHFINLSPNELNKLLQFFLDHQVQIYIVIRNWSRLLYSHWNESVKHGFALSVKEYFDNVVSGNLHHLRFDHHKVLKNFEKVIPKSNFHILLYDSILKHNDNLCQYFINKVTEGDFEIPQNEFRNKKLNEVDLDILRLLNHLYFTTYKLEPKGEIRKRYLQLKAKNEITISSYFLKTRPNHSEQYSISTLHPFFKDIEKRLVEDYGSQIDVEHLTSTLFHEDVLNVDCLNLEKFIEDPKIGFELESLLNIILEVDE